MPHFLWSFIAQFEDSLPCCCCGSVHVCHPWLCHTPSYYLTQRQFRKTFLCSMLHKRVELKEKHGKSTYFLYNKTLEEFRRMFVEDWKLHLRHCQLLQLNHAGQERNKALLTLSLFSHSIIHCLFIHCSSHSLLPTPSERSLLPHCVAGGEKVFLVEAAETMADWHRWSDAFSREYPSLFIFTRLCENILGSHPRWIPVQLLAQTKTG